MSLKSLLDSSLSIIVVFHNAFLLWISAFYAESSKPSVVCVIVSFLVLSLIILFLNEQVSEHNNSYPL